MDGTTTTTLLVFVQLDLYDHGPQDRTFLNCCSRF